MKPGFIPILVAGALAGCDDQPQPNSGELEQARRKAAEAEQRAAETEESRDHWQTFALFTGVGAVVLLFVGAALGSKARNDVGRN